MISLLLLFRQKKTFLVWTVEESQKRKSQLCERSGEVSAK
jgi:hypothetical protein